MKDDPNQNPPRVHITTEMRYVYHADVCRVVDGDTVDVNLMLGDFLIDLGLSIKTVVLESQKTERLRLYGINAPETNRKDERIAGAASKAWLIGKLADANSRITIRTFLDKTGKYGRLLALIFSQEPRDGQYTWANSINKEMVDLGYAKEVEY